MESRTYELNGTGSLLTRLRLILTEWKDGGSFGKNGTSSFIARVEWAWPPESRPRSCGVIGDAGSSQEGIEV